MRLADNGGVVCWNVNDSTEDGSESLTSCKQKIYFREECGFNIHDTMIYQKSNSALPERNRYNQCFEYVFVLAKGKLRCFNPLRDKPNVTAGMKAYGTKRIRERDGSLVERHDRKPANEFGIRGNVWLCKTAGQENPCKAIPHPAVMSYELCRDLIRSWSNPNDLILDPFAGYCTTAIACIKTNRQFIGIEISEEYCELSAKRIEAAFAQPMLDLEVA